MPKPTATTASKCEMLHIMDSLNFVAEGPTGNNPALVKIMAPARPHTIIWINGDTVPWRILAALMEDELIPE